jgi:hypothetical protein
MNSKPNKYVIIIIVLILSNSVIIYNYYKRSIVPSKVNNNLSNGSDDLLNANFGSLITQNEGIPIDKDILFIDLHNKVVPLEKTGATKNNKIIFRFSSLDCSLCINRILNVLNKFPENIKKNKFMIMYDGDEFRNFDIKFKSLNTVIPAFLISSKNESYEKSKYLGIPIEGKGLPFFFSLNNSNETDNIYIPDQEKPDYIKNYLNFLLRKMEGV